MTIAHTLVKSWSNGGTTIEKTETIEAGGEVNIDENIADSTTNGEVACVLDVSQLKSLMISCDQEVLLETNSGSSADDSYTINPNAPILWSVNDGTTCPLGTDVTALFITNASGATAKFKFRALIDPTV